MVEDRQIAEGKDIHRRTGRTFYVATRLLPERVRHATYVLYGFFRIADEIVDSEDAANRPAAEQRAELNRLRAAATGREPTDDPVLAAFAELKERHGIPDEEVDEFVDAMASDIEKSRYETYEELEAYMRGSAAAVGVMMTAIMETDREEMALPHAIALGEAFQLTNFLRDVREDILDRDRIYLPLETLDKHGVTEAQIRDLRFDESFRDAMHEELRRAERKYREGVAGIKYLPEDCQFAVLLAAVLYAEHHRLIRKQGYDVLSTEPSLSTARKLKLVVQTRWHWAWNKDPEAVFDRVSAVPSEESSHHHEREAGEALPMQ